MLQQTSDYSPKDDFSEESPVTGQKSCSREVYKEEVHTFFQTKQKNQTVFIN